MNSPRISSPRMQSPSVMRTGTGTGAARLNIGGSNSVENPTNAFAQYGDFFNTYRWKFAPLDRPKPNTRSSAFAPIAPGGIRSS